MNRNLIAFRNNLVETSGVSSVIGDSYIVAGLQSELMNLGYMLSANAYNALLAESAANNIQLYNDIVNAAKNNKSADVKYKPFWKNFPADVEAMDVREMYLAAIIHYWSNGTWEPTQELKARGFAFEGKTFITLELAKSDWLETVASNLASFSKPLDAQNLADLVAIIKAKPGIELPPITVKETLAAAISAGAKIKVKNPVDVLRVAVAMSGGDSSLSKLPSVKDLTSRKRADIYEVAQVEENRSKQKFKKFTRAERRTLLGMLESLHKVDAGEMARHLGRWKRLGEVLHPGEYKDQFPKAFAAFNALRNEKVRTFAGEVDMAFKESFSAGLAKLSTRPGEYARKLDWLLRQCAEVPKVEPRVVRDTAFNKLAILVPTKVEKAPEVRSSDDVLDNFFGIIDKVSSKVLFELYDHFEGRLEAQPRMVMLKGSGSKSKVLEMLPPLDKSDVLTIQQEIEYSLVRRAQKLPAMGKVYIDPDLFKMPVPYSMQSSSEGASTLVRGTRFPITPGATTLRAFTHWYDQDGRIDVDLAGQFMDSKYKVQHTVSFYDLKNEKMKAWHSGDIRHRPGHCAEYIDFNINDAIKAGIKYVIFSVYNYNGNSMASVPQSSFGVMERSAPKSNEIFEPATAQQAIKLKANSTSAYPVLIDLEAMEWIWVDLENDSHGYVTSRGESGMIDKIKALTSNLKLSTAHLLSMHVSARGGELVLTPEEADVSFQWKDFSRNYTKLAPFMAL